MREKLWVLESTRLGSNPDLFTHFLWQLLVQLKKYFQLSAFQAYSADAFPHPIWSRVGPCDQFRPMIQKASGMCLFQVESLMARVRSSISLFLPHGGTIEEGGWSIGLSPGVRMMPSRAQLTSDGYVCIINTSLQLSTFEI